MTTAERMLKEIATFERTLVRHAAYAPTIGLPLTMFKLKDALTELRRERAEIEKVLLCRKVDAA
jgi:hypothetical protein